MLAWVGLAALLICPSISAAETVLIAATGGYRKPVLELVEAFRKETGLEAQAEFGHIKQIKHRADRIPSSPL